MLMNSRGEPHFGGCMLMNSRGEPPFGGCMLMNSRGGPPFGGLYLERGFASRDNFYGSSSICICKEAKKLLVYTSAEWQKLILM